jgi:hypothetical protein
MLFGIEISLFICWRQEPGAGKRHRRPASARLLTPAEGFGVHFRPSPMLMNDNMGVI